jgi:hypothetical protein
MVENGFGGESSAARLALNGALPSDQAPEELAMKMQRLHICIEGVSTSCKASANPDVLAFDTFIFIRVHLRGGMDALGVTPE